MKTGFNYLCMLFIILLIAGNSHAQIIPIDTTAVDTTAIDTTTADTTSVTPTTGTGTTPPVSGDTTITKTKACPSVCEDSCKYRIVQKFDSCGTSTIEISYNSPPRQDQDTFCVADIDREPLGGTGKIEWELCDSACTKCELTADYFPDNSPIPYGPVPFPPNPIPAGKKRLSAACWASLGFARAPTPGSQGIEYRFRAKKLSSQFKLVTFCDCIVRDPDVIGIDLAMLDVEQVEITGMTGISDADVFGTKIDGYGKLVNPGERNPGEISIKTGKFLAEDALLAASEHFYIASAYPNPTSGIFNIEFYSELNARHFTVYIFDAQGRLVQSVTETALRKGKSKVSFDTGDLPIGFYHYSLVIGNERLNGKLVIGN